MGIDVAHSGVKLGVVLGLSWPGLGMGSDVTHPGVKMGVVSV